MKILQHKKKQMQVVKIILFFLVSVHCGNSYSQNIKGGYQRLDPLTATQGVGIEYLFTEDSTFIEITYKHIGGKEISQGEFSVRNDTLFLDYKESETPCNGEIIKIREKVKIPSGPHKKLELPLYTSIKVFNENSKPIEGAILVLQNADKNAVMAFMSDSKGKFPHINLYDNYVKYLQISALGNEEVLIKTDSLYGFSTEMEITLDDSSMTYNPKNGTKIFLIKELTDKEIILISLNNLNNKVILKKID